MTTFHVRSKACQTSLRTDFCLFIMQAALGHDYVADVEQHSSQKDASKGFGGKFGVQKDRVDRVRIRTRVIPKDTPLTEVDLLLATASSGH